MKSSFQGIRKSSGRAKRKHARCCFLKIKTTNDECEKILFAFRVRM